MVSTPTQEEANQQHQERVASMDNPEPPTPTQEEADALKDAAYLPEPGPDDPAAHEAHEARRARRRDMKPEAGSADYKTR
jgi:hypothetical protein